MAEEGRTANVPFAKIGGSVLWDGSPLEQIDTYDVAVLRLANSHLKRNKAGAGEKILKCTVCS